MTVDFNRLYFWQSAARASGRWLAMREKPSARRSMCLAEHRSCRAYARRLLGSLWTRWMR